jgi:PAS domain S-box-containing protein
MDLDSGKVAGAELLATALQAVAQPVWVVDHHGQIRFANAAAVAALGYADAGELIGRDSHETIHHHRPDGSPYPAGECPMLRPHTTGESVTSELDWFFRSDGSMFRVSYVSAPLDMPEGRGAVVAFTDIEDRLRAERVLHERDEMLAAQQTSLQRLAALVAGGAASADVFAAIAREVAQVIALPMVAVWRYDDDGMATVIGEWSDRPHPFRVGTSWPLDGPTITAKVLASGRPARIEEFGAIPGTIAGAARETGIGSCAGAPITVDGRVWGAMSADKFDPDPLPEGIEERLAEFTALVATAISNSLSREALIQLADEQAALRRVATLVAEGASPGVVLDAAVGEMRALLDAYQVALSRFEPNEEMLVLAHCGLDLDRSPVGWRVSVKGQSATAEVLRTGRSARIEDYEFAEGDLATHARATGVRSSVSVPVTLEGRVWGLITASWKGQQPPPPDTEQHMSKFAQLLDTAIAGADARAQRERLADKQAALRRVATLVAHESSPARVFAAVAEEVGRLLRVEDTAMLRYEDDGTATMVATWGQLADVVVAGMRLPVDGDNVAARVRRTGQPARIDDYATASGSFGTRMRELGIGAAVGCPIVVDGRLWGSMIAAESQPEPLPADTESRIAEFTELIATAISNLQARAEVARLAEEQAALRRVATLVAEGASPSSVLDAVASEMEALLGADQVALNRFEAGDELVVLAHRGLDVARTPVGSRVSIEGESATALVRQTGRPARMEGYESAGGPLAELARATGLRSSVSAPIAVEGKLWGVITASWKKQESPPPDTESRIGEFTELVATAIANSEARMEVERLADEQAALRRVATLVAHESPPDQVFAAVAEEVGRLLRVEDTTIFHYEDDWTATVVADRGERDVPMPVGSRVSLSGESATALVRSTGRSARVDDFSQATGPLADYTRDAGIGSTVGSPIVVDGRLWGAMIAATRTDEPMPADTESRMEQFTELVATAISNMQARSDLAASRARIVAAGDEERRRVVRDLHDGAQQRLVHTVITLKLACRALDATDHAASALVAQALDQAQQANVELRELAHGILPGVLTRGGLRAGVDALASRTPVPVEVAVCADRLPAAVEATAYFVVAEALTNVAKHAHARRAVVSARLERSALRVQVRDDGVGGAQPDGSGLLGLADRLACVDGRLRVETPANGGTLVAAEIPLRG